MIREAHAEDVEAVVRLVHELAEYERTPELCTLTEDQLHAAVFGPDAVVLDREELGRHLFGPRPYAEVLMAETPSGGEAGFALFFHTFSTWEGRPGIYLEDLFVRPEHRGRGYGRELLAALARLALERGCARLEWAVLDWNEPAIGFYRKLGARPMEDWTTFRLDGASLSRLAEQR